LSSEKSDSREVDAEETNVGSAGLSTAAVDDDVVVMGVAIGRWGELMLVAHRLHGNRDSLSAIPSATSVSSALTQFRFT
jgi:hypothetical protein